MFNDIVASGERGKSSRLQTNMRMLFSAAPRSDIWGKVFAVSLWVSRGSRVSCFVLRCEINEKPFDFPSKESVHVGRNCELCRRGRRPPLVERGEKEKKSQGERINKTISSHYNSVWGFYFYFALKNLPC